MLNMFQVSNKSPEQYALTPFWYFIANFKQIQHINLELLLNSLIMYLPVH